MMLSVGYSDVLSKVYLSDDLVSGRLWLYGFSFLLAIIISAVKTFKIADKEVTDGEAMSYDSIAKKMLRLARPLITFYFFIAIAPLLMTAIEVTIDSFADSFGLVSKLNNITENTFSEELQEQSMKDMVVDIVTGEFTILSFWEDVVEIGFLKLSNLINTYLFGFALGVYFLWLLVLEMFTPIAVLGFVYKEDMGKYADRWVSNMIACKLYLVFLFVANIVAVGFYQIFKEDDYNGILVAVIFIMFRVTLYRQAFNLASKVI